MFEKFILENKNNIFEELSNSTNFENVINGRSGTIIVDYKNNLVPIVRSTTVYNKPAQKFLPIHYEIIRNIREKTSIDVSFNNALVEIYDSKYRTMKFHSDQSLDLDENSYICLFSCYKNDAVACRKLIVKNKTTNDIIEFFLENNSIILFSVETNKQFLHKIILDKNSNDNNLWLGVTFRLSKTIIKFINEIPYFDENNKILRIASSDERKEFAKHKGIENLKIGYDYPKIDYTISISDTLLPK